MKICLIDKVKILSPKASFVFGMQEIPFFFTKLMQDTSSW